MFLQLKSYLFHQEIDANKDLIGICGARSPPRIPENIHPSQIAWQSEDLLTSSALQCGGVISTRRQLELYELDSLLIEEGRKIAAEVRMPFRRFAEALKSNIPV